MKGMRGDAMKEQNKELVSEQQARDEFMRQASREDREKRRVALELERELDREQRKIVMERTFAAPLPNENAAKEFGQRWDELERAEQLDEEINLVKARSAVGFDEGERQKAAVKALEERRDALVNGQGGAVPVQTPSASCATQDAPMPRGVDLSMLATREMLIGAQCAQPVVCRLCTAVCARRAVAPGPGGLGAFETR